MIGIQFWKSPDRRNEFLMLHKFQSGLKYNYVKLFTHEALKRRGLFVSPTRIIDVREMKLCGGQSATYIRGTKKYSIAGEESAEAMFTVVNDATYMLLYVHPLNVQPNGEAEAALHALCAED